MGDYDRLEFFLKYPLVRAVAAENSRFEGFLTVNDEDYELRFEFTGDGFNLETKDSPMWSRFAGEIEVAERSSGDALTFVGKLRAIVASKNATPSSGGGGVRAANLYWRTLNEYAEFRQFYFNIESCVLAADLSQIDIKTSDDANRTHFLTIGCDYDSGGTFFVKKQDLPGGESDYKADKRNGAPSLRLIYEEFVAKLEELQGFFDAMDEIDAACWVLDPESPKRSDVHRRIVLQEKNTSVLLTFDVLLLERSLPDLKILGPERATAKYRENLSANLPLWTPSGSVVQDIAFLLGVSNFPGKPPPPGYGTNGNDAAVPAAIYEDGDCCICYSRRRDGKLTEIVCPNERCECSFHVLCLYQWLAPESARKSFDEISGMCPACEKVISCPVPSDPV